jgi:protoheme IX farnesyltransferase
LTVAVSDFVEVLPAPVPVRARRASATWRDYVTLTKPRIMSLLVLTAVCAMIAAAGGAPSLTGLVALAIGGGLACGGASALNHVLDRDIDRLMGPRTASRPVAAGRINPPRAVAFATVLLTLSFAVMVVFDNPLAAVLALGGGAYYVVIYTVWLKRTTPHNIVVGGAAGAVPALSGWAAASGHLGLGAFFLFGIVLLWTPPHFWALALLLERQYAAARIPMLPVVRGARTTALRVLAYAVVPVAAPPMPGFSFFLPLVPRGRLRARCRVRRSGVDAVARRHARPRRRPLPLLAALPRAAVRRGRARCGVALNQACSGEMTADRTARLGAALPTRAMSITGARALVVEDDRATREEITAHLRREGFQVLESGSGLEALSLLRRGTVDIALVDVVLPEIDGLELVRRVRQESTVPIIMLTARGRQSARIAGLDAGADDYVVRPFSLAEVTARMRAQLRRARGFVTEETVLRTGEVELDLGARRCTIDGREVGLTRREFDLLGALLRYPGRIHTREQLLGLVWGADDITPKTVDVHVAALRRKLGSAISIATLRGVGYRLDLAPATGRSPRG